MKTLVLFDTPQGLYSLMLSEMPLPPVEGRQYIFSGKRFEVIEIIECLGNRDDTGRVKGANEKLMDHLRRSSRAKRIRPCRFRSLQGEQPQGCRPLHDLACSDGQILRCRRRHHR